MVKTDHVNLLPPPLSFSLYDIDASSLFFLLTTLGVGAIALTSVQLPKTVNNKNLIYV